VQPARRCPFEEATMEAAGQRRRSLWALSGQRAPLLGIGVLLSSRGGTTATTQSVASCCSCESPRIQTVGCNLGAARSMVVCLAAMRKPLRAQATRYMVGRVTGESREGEISIFDTQFEPLTIFDIQIDGSSKFDIKLTNFFRGILTIFHLFTFFSYFFLFISLFTGHICPWPYLFLSRVHFPQTSKQSFF